MKLLVTGGSGFIGRNLALQYSARHVVKAPGRRELDLLNAGAVKEYLEQGGFDAVIHCATERSNRATESSPALLERNCRMFFNLARNRQAFGRMLFLSSGAIYDRAHWHGRIAEEEFDRHVPVDDYGFSKYVCAQALAAMNGVYEMRLFGVFGPHEDWRVRFLSNACCRAVWDMPVVVRRNVRFDYLDVEDLGWILDAFLKNQPKHRSYNVCTGRVYELKQLAGMVVKASGKSLEIEVRDERPGLEYSGDNGRLLEELPDFQFRTMGDSVARLYRWYESEKETIDRELLRFDE